LRHETAGISSAPKEVVLRIFIAFKNLLSLAGFEAANLMSNGKYGNQYTTEGDNFGARWRWVVSFRPKLLYPEGKNAVAHWIGDWMDLRDSVHTATKKKSALPGFDTRSSIA
jgi:hypothetical protein